MTDANISNINSGNWVAKYFFNDNGDMAYRTIQSNSQSFSYNGHLMTNADGNTLDYDENGQLTTGVDTTLEYNRDSKLRSGQKDGNSISLKYDPAGNRIYKEVNYGTAKGKRKYIVDVVGDLPVILLELDPNDDMNIEKTYIYGNSQILAQHSGDHTASRRFYLHDRLGSARLIIGESAEVLREQVYGPFGGLLHKGGAGPLSVYRFMFAGQYYDNEIGQYYLRARQYDPYIYRFTSRDPVFGKFEEPLTLHKYLYCGNDPINRIDPFGLWTVHIQGVLMGSFIGSFMGQAGLVIDDDGNVGWIVTHNVHGITSDGAPSAPEDWAGFGTPAVSAGVALGITNADTIYDLQGRGLSIGGSLGPVTGDFLTGEQRSGEPYYGFEITFGLTYSAFGGLGGPEVHSHNTMTTVKPLDWNYREALGSMQSSIEESLFNVRTVGQAYKLSLIWGQLE